MKQIFDYLSKPLMVALPQGAKTAGHRCDRTVYGAFESDAVRRFRDCTALCAVAALGLYRSGTLSKREETCRSDHYFEFGDVLPRNGAGIDPDGLSDRFRQIPPQLGRSGRQIHPLRPVFERSDALRHLVHLRHGRYALFRRHSSGRLTASNYGAGVLLLRFRLQALARTVPPLDGRRLPGSAHDRHFLSFGHIERLGRFRADDHSNQGFPHRWCRSGERFCS